MNWEILGKAIVARAVGDYMNALTTLKHSDDIDERKRAERVVADCEKFFQSKWYTDLTTIDHRQIIRHIKQEVANDRSNEQARLADTIR